jgi:phosphomannomutase
MAGSGGLAKAVREWIEHDPDPTTRGALQRMVTEGRWAELSECFGGRLAFGTAGLRAELGPGPLRMNRLVVRQAAAGLLRYLRDVGRAEPLVVIGYDGRHQSDAFAADSAGVVAAAGGRAVLFDAPGPTPLLAFALRRLGADAAVMVTASHNPPADNGYKVYLADGAQIVAPIDQEIAARIATAGLDVAVAPVEHPAISRLGVEVVADYVDALLGQLTGDERRVAVAYTPLHGVGADLFQRAFAAAGFPPPHLVAAQAEPDPDFPTVAFPNPEEPGALDLGLALARDVGADVLLANDPDADRLGVAVPDGQRGWRALTGNEIGVLLADHLLRRRGQGADRLVVTTVVSSRLLSRMADALGVHYAETLTGFKWIVRPAIEHPEWSFVFGYEEALGYSVGPAVRDKDGIGAALLFAELVAGLRQQGSTVPARLEELARRFGLHATASWSKRFASRAGGAAEAAAVMGGLRASAPPELAGLAVERVEDLARRVDGPRSDTVIWELEGGARAVFRPSGTEPKLKVYLEVVEPAPPARPYGEVVAAAQQRLAALQAALERLLDTNAATGGRDAGRNAAAR